LSRRQWRIEDDARFEESCADSVAKFNRGRLERGGSCVTVRSRTKHSSAAGLLRIGFVQLIDAAPIIVAQEAGYIASEGLKVSLHRQIGWGNVRDKLTFGQLHASHALLGMAPISVIGKDQFAEPLVAIASLGSGGNGITFSRRLVAMGVTSAEALARLTRRREGRPLVFAHVFGCSTHHYLLREWLARGGVDVDQHLRLCAVPPPQMPALMANGFIDGFCVGEPWNTVAEHEKQGTAIVSTTQIVPDHPEKMLTVSRRWLTDHPDAAEKLVRATLRGCAFCHDPANAEALSRMLAAPQYLNVPQPVLAKSLANLPGFRSWAPGTTFPSVTRAMWLLNQMLRWGHLRAEMDLPWIARQSVDSGPYRAATASMGWPCPADEPAVRLISATELVRTEG
jgi:ABC-type nitrate/sulfonate/bicarbonate transport system substrate-binding protein